MYKERLFKMTGEKGMQYLKKRFTIHKKYMGEDTKCFKSDCINEGETCKNCSMIQGKFVFYQPKQ